MPAVLTELDLRRRNCKKCTRWKHAVDFPWRWKSNGVEREIPLILSTCLVCKSEKEKERYNALTPKQKKEKGRKANEQAWLRRTKLKEEVHQLQKKNSKLKERLAYYRKRVGHPKRTYGDDILLDILPIRMFLLRESRMREGGVSEIARIVGIDEASVRRHVNGYYWVSECTPRPVRQVTLEWVDKYLTKLNAEERLEELYPEVDELLGEMLGDV